MSGSREGKQRGRGRFERFDSERHSTLIGGREEDDIEMIFPRAASLLIIEQGRVVDVFSGVPLVPSTRGRTRSQKIEATLPLLPLFLSFCYSGNRRQRLGRR